MVHVYFALRPEKFVITKSMVVRHISREHYLEHHDPERWAMPRSERLENRNAIDSERCNVIEECYEYMLAFAGQGLPGEGGERRS